MIDDIVTETQRETILHCIRRHYISQTNCAHRKGRVYTGRDRKWQKSSRTWIDGAGSEIPKITWIQEDPKLSKEGLCLTEQHSSSAPRNSVVLVYLQ